MAFFTGMSCRFDNLIPKKKPTVSTVVSEIVQDALNEHFLVQEELELETGPPLKQELLVTPPTKRSKPNISSIFKEAVEFF
jgi:hypothetical protein